MIALLIAFLGVVLMATEVLWIASIGCLFVLLGIGLEIRYELRRTAK